MENTVDSVRLGSPNIPDERNLNGDSVLCDNISARVSNLGLIIRQEVNLVYNLRCSVDVRNVFACVICGY